jgi:hypothetical protein
MKKSQWKRKIWTWNVKSYVIYDYWLLFACKRPRESQGLAPDLSLPIIVTLLSMFIDNERPGLAGASTHIILIINVMICIYFVLIWTLNIDNSECFGVKYVKIYPEMTSQYFFFLNMVLVDFIGNFFDISEYFWQMTVCVYNFIL